MIKVTYFLILITFTLIFISCSPTTTLINTQKEYIEAKPEKSRITFTYALPNYKLTPIITAQVGIEILTNRSERYTYSTTKPVNRILTVLGGLALAGGATYMFMEMGKLPVADSTKKKYLLLGGIAASIGAFGLLADLALPMPSYQWTRDSVFLADTIYQSKQLASNSIFNIYSSHITKTRSYEASGDELQFDVRDLYDTRKKDELDLTISSPYATINRMVSIPFSYIQKIMKDEETASGELHKADALVVLEKYGEAFKNYSNLISDFPNTNAALSAREKKNTIEYSVKEEHNNSIRKVLASVSQTKVVNSFDRAGIKGEELALFGNQIQSLSEVIAYRLMIEGLGFNLERYAAQSEYNALSIHQKIYSVIAASERISRSLGKSKESILQALISISFSTAQKLSKVQSQELRQK